MDEASSLTELGPSEPPGDIGGDPDGGECGGENRVEVGEDPKDPLLKPNESRPSRLGDPSYDSVTDPWLLLGLP